ncbi:MAG TPA: CpsB/CapC family capsule biosynthesis tyrosine phosphatase [Gaiellaceae bacterium]|nr:CpsB/CapC family capsule biosynthesis tyrosine phosphatase [Gaiellaceae bacterium]
MIDLHAHILPGVDDGVRSLEEACELARVAVADGIAVTAATPHVRDDYPTTPEQVERGVEEVRRSLGDAGIPLEVVHGAEVDIGALARLTEEEVIRLTIGQAGRYLLVEFPYGGWPVALEGATARLLGAGITPILAHPERNDLVQQSPRRLLPVVESGCLVQVTAASLAGGLGRAAATTGHELVRLRLAHVAATDAHGPTMRAMTLSACADAVRDAAVARYLTEEAPAAVLAGEPVPPPPPPTGRRSLWRRR